jgi:hypothetical protein
MPFLSLPAVGALHIANGIPASRPSAVAPVTLPMECPPGLALAIERKSKPFSFPALCVSLSMSRHNFDRIMSIS